VTIVTKISGKWEKSYTEVTMTNNPYAIHEPAKDKPDEIEIPPNGTSLDLLQAVYRRSDLPLTTRMRAAIAALNYELPRLAVTAQITDQDIATVLDRRIAHYQELQRANGSKLIEAKVEAEPVEPESIEVKPPTPSQRYRIYSRFNRRF
jgi:hypothetical protein